MAFGIKRDFTMYLLIDGGTKYRVYLRKLVYSGWGGVEPGVRAL